VWFFVVLVKMGFLSFSQISLGFCSVVVTAGVGLCEAMAQSRVSVKANLSNLCLSVVVATGQKCAVATASAAVSSPAPASWLRRS